MSFIFLDGADDVHPNATSDSAIWDMFEEFLMSDMGYGQLTDRMKTHLSSRYRCEDWKEIEKVLFSGDGDNGLALQNVRAIRLQYVSLPVPSQSFVSCTPTAGSSRWQNTVDSGPLGAICLKIHSH